MQDLAEPAQSAAYRPVDNAMPNICVVIATRGRAEVLCKTVAVLQQQTVGPARLIVSCSGPADIAGLPSLAHVQVVESRPGLPAQRNAALDRVPHDTDIVVFFDDDFVPAPNWLGAVWVTFRANPDIACITGNVIADGIKGPGLTLEDAQRHLRHYAPPRRDWIDDSYSPYGCNMAFRWSVIRDQRFDERLVLYGWQEDRDFGARVVQRGHRAVRIGSAYGVHLGAKSGRTSGRRLGYSQVVNPLYLMRKGTMSRGNALSHILRNMAANAARSVLPDALVDRRGRLVGNLLALGDLVRRRAAPERAANL